jgi:hypothetical protein
VQAVSSEVREELDPYQTSSRVHPGQFLPNQVKVLPSPKPQGRREGSSLGGMTPWRRRLWQSWSSTLWAFFRVAVPALDRGASLVHSNSREPLYY